MHRPPALRAARGSLPRRCRILVILFVTLGLFMSAAAPGEQAPQDPVATVITQLEAAVQQGSPDALTTLVASQRDAAAMSKFAAAWLAPGATRVALKERERVDLPGGAKRLVLEALIETGREGRLGTWQVDVRDEAPAWRITSIKTVGSIEGLHRLQLDAGRQFKATNLHVTAEDLELVLPHGTVFTADVSGAATAVVLIGRGEMIFTPAPEVERGQVGCTRAARCCAHRSTRPSCG